MRLRGVAIFAAAALGSFLISGETAPASSGGGAAPETPVEQFHAVILPMLEKHCYECHGDGYDKGKVAFDSLDTEQKILNPELWLRVLNNTRAGLMPAERKPPLSPVEQQTLEQWIKQSVFKLDPRNPDPGRVTLRRLNRVEYRNTVRDLLGVDFNTDEEFPPDDTGYGFDNIGDALTMSPMLMEKYVAAAQTIVTQAVPLAPTEPAQKKVPGDAFAANNPSPKAKGLRLPYYDAASVTTAVAVQDAGRYRVVLDLDVDGNFEFDPARTRAVFKVDGAETLNREFGWFHERAFTFETTHPWTAGEHRFALEVTPLNSVERKKDPLTLVLRNVTIIGPLEKEKWVPTKNYARFFPRPIPDARTARREYARDTLATFAAKAYRRPLEPGTAERLATFAESIYRQRGKSFEQGVAHAMAAVLASPHFLFRHEAPAGPADGRSAYIDEFSLASRLSYFLWSTMPDDELIALAGRVELRKNLPAQVRRMLADPRAESLAQNFTGQWLQTRDVPGIAINTREILVRDAGAEKTLQELKAAWRRGDEPTAKALAKQIDATVENQGKGIKELDGKLRASMRRETEMYFAHVVREDRPITEFLDSNYTFVNDQLATLYGIPDVSGPELRLVTLPAGNPRGGVLTQASSLVVTSNPDRTSPVKRGLFVLQNFLGTPPPPPPPNIPALEASETGHEHEPTLRESLIKHRENPSCASCHNRMDPIGLAFENFNALGMWRDTERRQPILAPGELITGEKFDGVAQLKRILAHEHRQDFYRTLTDKMLTYAMGRGTEYYDVDTIDGIVNRLTANDGRFSVMLMGIVESAPFQKMRLRATDTVGNQMASQRSKSARDSAAQAGSTQVSQ